MPATTLRVATGKPIEFINITQRIKRIVQESGIQGGICTIYVPHTTCGITINEAADPDVERDILKELGKIVPLHDEYLHAEGNSAAHIKTSLMGSNSSIPISDGRLLLGTWQGIFLCEFDGPRNRKVYVQIQ
jgi:secondary thiamine-phosphate synthase enzyme